LRPGPGCGRLSAGGSLVPEGRQTKVSLFEQVPYRIAGSRVEVIDDCGHVVQADQPERSWTAISGFLAG
jgi:pimeloyl-ACP methyl ester carboxylesterase